MPCKHNTHNSGDDDEVGHRADDYRTVCRELAEQINETAAPQDRVSVDALQDRIRTKEEGWRPPVKMADCQHNLQPSSATIPNVTMALNLPPPNVTPIRMTTILGITTNGGNPPLEEISPMGGIQLPPMGEVGWRVGLGQEKTKKSCTRVVQTERGKKKGLSQIDLTP